MSRTVIIRGPLTDDELALIVGVMQRIEAARPGETFEVYIDSSDTETQIEKFVEMITPLRPGYERVVRYRERYRDGSAGFREADQ